MKPLRRPEASAVPLTAHRQRRHSANSTLAYQPALDGLRGLAVAAVVAFHLRAPWMTGGYVGVSVFFTLSGFLITSLLITEHGATGTIALGAFYGRRARRLLPAALITIVGVVVAADAGWFRRVPHLRADLFGAVSQVSNWTQLLRGGSYSDQIVARAGVSSPLIHFWSLSIEEQYYWLWPIVMIGLFALVHRRQWRIERLLIGAAVVASAGAFVIARAWGPNAVYWATPARAAEIMIGAALAGIVQSGHLPRVPVGMTAIAGALLVLASVALPADHGLAYVGGMPLIALCTAVLLAGLQQHNRAASAVAARPLRALGRVSYGVYVFHWPVFVAFADRTQLRGSLLVTAELSTTCVLTLGSYWLLEQPVRRLRLRARSGLALASGTMVFAACSVVSVPAVNDSYWQVPMLEESADVPAASLAPLAAMTTATVDSPRIFPTTAPRIFPTTAPAMPPTTAPAMRPTTAPAMPPTTAPAMPPTTSASMLPTNEVSIPPPVDVTPPTVSRPVRILLVGDSVAEAMGNGFIGWARANPTLGIVAVAAAPGCGLVRGGVALNATDAKLRAGCAYELDRRLPALLHSFAPDIVVVMVTLRDHEPQNFGHGVLANDDPTYQSMFTSSYSDFITTVTSKSAARVVFTRMPSTDPLWLGNSAAANDFPARNVYESNLAGLAAIEPDRVRVVDFRSWVKAAGLDNNQPARPDGQHWSPAAATDVVTRWFGPTLMTIAVEP